MTAYRFIGLSALAAAFAAALASTPVHAADYYAAKTIELVVGGDAGGGYDIYARTLARHITRHIPGAPNIIVKNMPGAGSSRAGVYMSAVAPKDGTSIAALMPGAIIGPLLDDKPNLQFDPAKVIYVGTADSGVRIWCDASVIRRCRLASRFAMRVMC